jgi:hypothetical protein
MGIRFGSSQEKTKRLWNMWRLSPFVRPLAFTRGTNRRNGVNYSLAEQMEF